MIFIKFPLKSRFRTLKRRRGVSRSFQLLEYSLCKHTPTEHLENEHISYVIDEQRILSDETNLCHESNALRFANDKEHLRICHRCN